jgi:hypothetical protein
MVAFVHRLRAAMDILEWVGGTKAVMTDITGDRQKIDSIASREW